jgi:hypothetical protein
MGFNTVALVLNDRMDRLIDSPKSITYALCHPPMSGIEQQDYLMHTVRQVANDAGEINPLLNGLSIMPTYHADDLHLILAGQNALSRVKIINRNLQDGTVTVQLPAWMVKNKITIL